jgi:hypothetical protein
MTTQTTKSNSSTVTQIFDDLDKYRDFCREYGYRFDERDLYSSQNYIWRQYQKFVAGKTVKDQWSIDLARWKERQATKKRV